MSERSTSRSLTDRPLVMASLSIGVAAVCTFGLMLWASADPVRVVVGKEGRHDQAHSTTCLDCHVPFEGTPSSRCLAPGCHGDLATGTPPRDGPAMPVRFHAALRGYACSACHGEHEPDVLRAFNHRLVPDAARDECRDCHVGSQVTDHARTDAVACSRCHGLDDWKGAEIEHERVAQQPCDLCHARPETAAHASVAGACGDCHETATWAVEDEDDGDDDDGQDAAK